MLTLLLLAATLSSPARMPEILAPEVMVTIAPSSMDEFQLLKRKTPETYTCTLSVRDADTKSASIGADLVLRPGQSDKVSRVIGEALVSEMYEGVIQSGDMLLSARLDAMAKDGRVEIRGGSARDMRSSEVRLPVAPA